MSDFQKHPSEILNNLYLQKNYQGANPFDAKILFIGRDPNWAIDIDKMQVFEKVEEYLNDGIKFWNKYDFHHPFLDPNYRGDGKRYHRMFSKLNFKSNYSDKIAFVELIGFPTTGMAKKNNNEFKKLLFSEENKSHLITLNELICDDKKIVFVAWGLIKDFKLLNSTTGLFKKISSVNTDIMNIRDLNKLDNIYIHRHFSDCISNETLDKMSKQVHECLK